MPVACSTSSLTGQDGLVMFSPAGTHWCLKDHTDFSAGTSITVPTDADFRVGDSVVFKVEDGGKLDSALTAGTTYYVVAVVAGKVDVSATKGGAPITLNGDGGNGSSGSGIASLTAATAGAGYTPGTYTNVSLKQGTNVTAKATVVVPAGGGVTAAAITITTAGTGYATTASSISLEGGSGPGGAAIDAAAPTTPFSGTATLTAAVPFADSAGHVNIAFAPVDALCGVKEWSLDLSRETVDTTTLPCKVGGAASRYATFRTSQAGFASGEGTMTVVFTSGQGMSNRLLANSMYKNSLATVKLYINAVAGTGAAIDDTQSNYIEAQVSLNGFSVSVNTDDVVEAEIQFTLAAQPKALFGVTL